MNKLRKKNAEESAKQAEVKAVTKAVIETFNETDTEEDSPRKAGAHTAGQARVLGNRGRSLFQELKEMAGDSVEAKTVDIS